MELNRYSKTLTQDETQPAAQAMLYGIGLNEADMQKAQVGIVSTGFEGNTCNMHLNELAVLVKKSIGSPEMLGLIFNTIGVSDGMANGTEGMRYSLVSRDIIADSIEAVAGAQWYDALIAVMGCDKNMPGALMAMGRLNRPSLLIYGGTIRSGSYKNRKLNIVSVFEALGKKLNGEISPEDFKQIIQRACPGAGACGGMYTANTMACAIEALGMSLPYSSSNPALSIQKTAECAEAGAAMLHLLRENIRPKDIMTFKAFENAMSVVMALGGSTNAVLHLIAMARAVDIDLSLEDFQRISNKTPVLADLKPGGEFLMEDLHNAGGTPALMKLLLESGYLHGDCLTVTGKNLEDNLNNLPALKSDQRVIFPVTTPLKKTGHIQILYGNLARTGAVAKITGKEGDFFEGTAKVFDDEFEIIEAIRSGQIKPGNVVVIRYVGPKGGPGMPEMLKPTSAIMGAGLGKQVALITDGRFSGGSHGFVVGHITPEAFEGGVIALVRENDRISIDIRNNSITLHVSDAELNRRKREWRQPAIKAGKGVLLKYARCVASASQGCITDSNQ